MATKEGEPKIKKRVQKSVPLSLLVTSLCNSIASDPSMLDLFGWWSQSISKMKIFLEENAATKILSGCACAYENISVGYDRQRT